MAVVSRVGLAPTPTSSNGMARSEWVALVLMVGAMSLESFSERLASYPHDKLIVVVGDRWDIQNVAIREGVRVLIVTGAYDTYAASVGSAAVDLGHVSLACGTWHSFNMPGLAVTIRSIGDRAGAAASTLFSSSNRCKFNARSTIVRSTSISVGFSQKS